MRPVPKDPHLFPKANIRPNSLELGQSRPSASWKQGLGLTLLGIAPRCLQRTRKAGQLNRNQPVCMPGSEKLAGTRATLLPPTPTFLFSFPSSFPDTFFWWVLSAAGNSCLNPRSLWLLDSCPVAAGGLTHSQQCHLARSALPVRGGRVFTFAES